MIPMLSGRMAVRRRTMAIPPEGQTFRDLTTLTMTSRDRRGARNPATLSLTAARVSTGKKISSHLLDLRMVYRIMMERMAIRRRTMTIPPRDKPV